MQPLRARRVLGDDLHPENKRNSRYHRYHKGTQRKGDILPAFLVSLRLPLPAFPGSIHSDSRRPGRRPPEDAYYIVIRYLGKIEIVRAYRSERKRRFETNDFIYHLPQNFYGFRRSYGECNDQFRYAPVFERRDCGFYRGAGRDPVVYKDDCYAL